MSHRVRLTWPLYQRHSLEVDGAEVRLTPKVCELALLLMLRRGQFVPLPQIIEFLWPDPDSEPDFSEDVIRTYATRLRRALPDGWTVLARATFCTDLMEAGHYHAGSLMLDVDDGADSDLIPALSLPGKRIRKRVRLRRCERQERREWLIAA